MAQFILLLHESGGTGSDLSPEEMQAIIGEYRAWSQKMGEAGKVLEGHKLTNDAGKVLKSGGGGIAVTDGPYSETKELIGGLFLIEAPDYAAAVEIAGTCPHAKYGSAIEVRQIDNV